MKVSDLEGPQLDFWIARAEGIEASRLILRYPPEVVEAMCVRDDMFKFNPSEAWLLGGPIIGREQISIWRYDGTVDDPIDMWFAATGGIHGWDDGSIAGVGKECCGETALIAAMRAYVASKFGDEVPDQNS